MYTDAENRPSNVQTVTGTDTTVYSTDVIDLVSASRDLGRGEVLRAYVNVETAYAGGTSIVAELIEHATSTGSSSPTVLATGPVTTVANAIAGAVLLDVVVPRTSKRYISFRYTTVGAVSAGAVSAHILANTDRPSVGIPMYTGR